MEAENCSPHEDMNIPAELLSFRFNILGEENNVSPLPSTDIYLV